MEVSRIENEWDHEKRHRSIRLSRCKVGFLVEFDTVVKKARRVSGGLKEDYYDTVKDRAAFGTLQEAMEFTEGYLSMGELKELRA